MLTRLQQVASTSMGRLCATISSHRCL
jgi:hypothetical protein